MAVKQSELSVITKAKDICSYIMTVTEKSPKRFRFTLVSKLQNYSLDIIEYLYRANEVYVKNKSADEIRQRLNYQHRAMADLNLLAYMAQLAMENGCILAKQYEQITKGVFECRNLLGAWINSDSKRFAK